MNEIKYINEKLVEKHLTTRECIDLMRDTLEAYSNKRCIQNLRTALRLDGDNLIGLMPGYVKDQNCFGTKVITVFPENYKISKPSHQGIVMIFDDKDGALKAVVDGEAITAKRTAAVSAVATDILASKDAKVMTLLGCGVQAEMHLESINHVRDLIEVRVWSLYIKDSTAFVQRMKKKYNIKITAVENSQDAVENADIICTLTPSKEPILFGDWVKKGVHINTVGACTPNARELDSTLVKKSKVFVDSFESATRESGDILIPIAEGVIDNSIIHAEIGEVILGSKSGREHENEVTVFESLGLAVEDIAAANYVYEKI